jgi:hypothetical protein
MRTTPVFCCAEPILLVHTDRHMCSITERAALQNPSLVQTDAERRLLHLVVARETENHDKVPFYHVVSGGVLFYYEFFTALAMAVGLLDAKGRGIVMRPLAQSFADVPTMRDLLRFMDHRQSGRRKRIPDVSSDHNDCYRDVAVAANPCLLSQSEAPPLHFSMLVGLMSDAPQPDMVVLATDTLVACGWPRQTADGVVQLAHNFWVTGAETSKPSRGELADSEQTGFLVQGFVDLDVADRVLYPSGAFGHAAPLTAKEWLAGSCTAAVDLRTQWRVFADPQYAFNNRVTAYVYGADMPVERAATIARFRELLRRHLDAKLVWRTRNALGRWSVTHRRGSERRSRLASHIRASPL